MGLQHLLFLFLVSTYSAYGFVFSCQEVKDKLINSNLAEPTEFVCLVPEEGNTNLNALKTIYAQIDKISVPLYDILSSNGSCVPRVTEEGSWRIVADPPITLDCNQQIALIFTSSLPDFIRVEKQLLSYSIDDDRVIVSPRAGMKIHSTKCHGNGNITIFTGSGTGVSEFRYFLESWRCSDVPDWIISFENVITIAVDPGVEYLFEITSDYKSETALNPFDSVSILTSGKSDNLQNAHPNENYALFSTKDVVTVSTMEDLSFDPKYDGTIQIMHRSNGEDQKRDTFPHSGKYSLSFNASYFEVHYLTSTPEIVWDNQDNFIIDISIGEAIPITIPTTRPPPPPPTTTRPKPSVGPGEVNPDGYCGCAMNMEEFDTDGTWKLDQIWLDIIFILDVSSGMDEGVSQASSLIETIVSRLGTDPSKDFYSRVGVITMADVVTVKYDLNMTAGDEIEVEMASTTKIDMTTAFKVALDMFKRGISTNSANRKHVKQVIYYVSNADPVQLDSGPNDFKSSDGIIIVNDFTVDGQDDTPGLEDLASPGYYFNNLQNYLDSYPLFCEVNCYCVKFHPYQPNETSRIIAAGGCYFSNQAGVTFSQAQKNCKKTQNGKISAPHDAAKEYFLMSRASSDFPKAKQPFWLGYSSDGSKWTFDDGSTSPYTHFAPGDNTNTGNPQCAYEVQDVGFTSYWHPTNCNAGYPAVCEMAPCQVGYSKCNEGT